MDATTTQTERRAVARHSATTITSVRIRFEGSEIVASVRDISVIGIGMLLRQHLEPGASLTLEPGDSNRRLSSELRAEVRYTKECDSNNFLVGCRFSRFLTIEDMLALG